MHKNFLWQAFLAVVILVTLIYTGIATYRYYNYVTLQNQASLTSTHWDIQEVSDEKYLLTTDYTFTLHDNTFSGTTVWSDSPYRNRWAAEKALPESASNISKAWYNPSHPDHSSLQKKFPIKECVSAAFLWALLLYFLWLGYYVSKK